MPSNPVPAQIVGLTAGWAGSDVTAANNELDVWMLGADGKVYHKWFRPGVGWSGPEELTAPL